MHILHSIQLIKAISCTSINTEKNAHNATKNTIGINIVIRGIERAIMLNTIVPIIPTSRHIALLHRHLFNAWFSVEAAAISAANSKPSITIASVSVIIMATTIPGMNLKKNSTPTAIAKTMLITMFRQPQPLLQGLSQAK